jgi:hypothetical protein
VRRVRLFAGAGLRTLAHWLRLLARAVEPAPLPPPVSLHTFVHRSRGWQTGWWREAQLRDPCVYCGAPATELDHVYPASKGGPNHWANRAPACSTCNRAKGARTLLQFLAERRRGLHRPVRRTGKTATTSRVERKFRVAQLVGVDHRQPYEAIMEQLDARRRRPSDVDLRRRG